MVYDGVHVLAEVDSTGGLRRAYTHGPGIDNWLAMTVYTGATAKTYFYLTDHQGTVHAVADETGTIVESYRFDAWGRVLGVYDSNNQPITQTKIGNRFLWQGREYYWSVGLYDFRARVYDPITGRFLSKDPIGITGGLNEYTFCANNPVNFVDPFGLDWFDNTANFFAGAGDSLTFGITDWVREQAGWNTTVNHNSTAYVAGEWTETAIEVAATGGSAALKTAAKKTGQKAARTAAAKATREIAREGNKLHHVNPLFGHPGGKKALFPTGGLPPSIHSGAWNLELLDDAAHLAAHRRMVQLESVAAKAVNPGMTALRMIRNSAADAYYDSSDCK
jgi:RHS repeat-associated protein